MSFRRMLLVLTGRHKRRGVVIKEVEEAKMPEP
jgi:hypothetical protein